jgi:hypothetical protein
MRLEEHFESSSTLQRRERVKLAALFWNNVGAGMWATLPNCAKFPPPIREDHPQAQSNHPNKCHHHTNCCVFRRPLAAIHQRS